MTERCPSCRGALPGGCSVCRPMPMPTYTMGRVEIGGVSFPLRPVTLSHTCPRCMRGLPCDPSSLSSLVGQIATHHTPTADEWKRDTFPQETQ